jgi:hypothetical protein
VFDGSAIIDATRLSRDVDVIASSVVQHLTNLLDSKVKITFEIEAMFGDAFTAPACP